MRKECGMWNVECGMRNAECGMKDRQPTVEESDAGG
jgi:hypothetical protein